MSCMSTLNGQTQTIMNRKLIQFVPGIVSICLLTPTVMAWTSPGHMIVALIAYDQMDPATRTKTELLKAHPRFNDHFEDVMPREARRGDERDKDQWIIAHAATPARSGTRLQRGREPSGCDRLQPPVVAFHQRADLSQRPGAAAIAE